MKLLNTLSTNKISGGNHIELEDGRIAYEDGHGGYMMNRRDAYQVPDNMITTCDMVPVYGPEQNFMPIERS